MQNNKRQVWIWGPSSGPGRLTSSLNLVLFTKTDVKTGHSQTIQQCSQQTPLLSCQKFSVPLKRPPSSSPRFPAPTRPTSQHHGNPPLVTRASHSSQFHTHHSLSTHPTPGVQNFNFHNKAGKPQVQATLPNPVVWWRWESRDHSTSFWPRPRAKAMIPSAQKRRWQVWGAVSPSSPRVVQGSRPEPLAPTESRLITRFSPFATPWRGKG